MTNLLGRTMLGAAAVLLVGGALALSAESGDDPAAHGQKLYDMHCAKCHGDKGRGDGPLGKKAATRPTDLTRLTETNAGAFPREVLRQVIDGRAKVPAHDTPEMPVWGETFARQAHAMIPVRLACVKYAASVRSAPGSNSPRKARKLKPGPHKPNLMLHRSGARYSVVTDGAHTSSGSQ